MTEVIGVRFKKVGKVYYFDPNGLHAAEGEYVIVETARGVECGEVAMPNSEVSDSSIVKPLKKALRKASENDRKILEENARLEKEAFRICEEKIAKHKLEMKLVAVEYTFDHSRILFYFSADGRVDFRELVKDLASVFRTRIELRQIGVRDEAKMIGGLGICGRPLCCTTFLDDFQPVSINMAKEQGLSLNPTKISGTCGRLMCCLKYESDTYKELIRSAPKVDSVVDTPQGRGTVMEVSLLKGCCKVRLQSSPDSPVVMPCEDCGRTQRPVSEESSCAPQALDLPLPDDTAEPVPEKQPSPARSQPRPARNRAPRPERPSDAGGQEKSAERSSQRTGRQHSQNRAARNGKKNPGEQPAAGAPEKGHVRTQPPSAGSEEAAQQNGVKKERSSPFPRRRHRGSRGGQRRARQDNKGADGSSPASKPEE